MTTETIIGWRGLETPSLEVLRLGRGGAGVVVRSDLVDAGARAFGLSYEWDLDPGWRTRSLRLRVSEGRAREMVIERAGDAAWRIDGEPRPDLDGCDEVDLSPTPFCNTLAIRQLGPRPGAPGELTALYLALPDLDPVPSRQRYERLGDRIYLFVDLGANPGFRARLEVDETGMVRRYDGLFEMLEDAGRGLGLDYMRAHERPES